MYTCSVFKHLTTFKKCQKGSLFNHLMPKLYLLGPLFCQSTSIQLSDVFEIYFLVNLKDKEERTSLPQGCITAHDYIFSPWKAKQGCISHVVHLSTRQKLNLLGWKISPTCTNPFLQQMHCPVCGITSCVILYFSPPAMQTALQDRELLLCDVPWGRMHGQVRGNPWLCEWFMYYWSLYRRCAWDIWWWRPLLLYCAALIENMKYKNLIITQADYKLHHKNKLFIWKWVF